MTDEANLLPVSEIGQQVLYCPLFECTLPHEMCKYGPHPDKCVAWLKENNPELYQQLTDGKTDSKSTEGKKKKSKNKNKNKKKLGEKVILISQIQRSKRKFVTSISGLDAFGLDLKTNAKKMAKLYACSASVVKCTPPPNEIQIQGDVKYEVAEFVLDKLKIPKDVIFFLEGKAKGKKGKRVRAFD
eukprot:CAMPEP_0197517094 /NCGR_PEP_ID=MMETSP1318-20131121/2056_1 /TAXON_ID=552666 /ORGANISM="Partenskyella glossopodia, Strain RCC365" /LENGTH=185 /DNA_ID=CAMNT_0043066367 /DNA_START=82 /DNA_END=639 /DNA_ORIENTATION=-